MRIARYEEFGPAEVLKVVDAAEPVPGPGQVLLRAERIGLNYIDTVMRAGTGGDWQPASPGNLTGEVVGTVVRGDVPGVSAGDRVAALVATDACAEYVLADADWLVPVPAEVDPAAATVLPMLAPLAAGLVHFGRVGPGETVLVHTAAGGVGHLLVQLARRAGARVIGSTGSAAKAEAVLALGAEAVVHTTEEGWPERVRELAPGGVDVILDALGGSAVETNLDLLAPYGRQVVYGALDRQVPSVSAHALFGLKSLSAFGSQAWWGSRPDEARAATAEVTELLRTGELRVEVAAVLPLEEVVEAHRLLEDRSRIGRVVLEVK